MLILLHHDDVLGIVGQHTRSWLRRGWRYETFSIEDYVIGMVLFTLIRGFHDGKVSAPRGVHSCPIWRRRPMRARRLERRAGRCDLQPLSAYPPLVPRRRWPWRAFRSRFRCGVGRALVLGVELSTIMGAPKRYDPRHPGSRRGADPSVAIVCTAIASKKVQAAARTAHAVPHRRRAGGRSRRY